MNDKKKSLSHRLGEIVGVVITACVLAIIAALTVKIIMLIF